MIKQYNTIFVGKVFLEFSNLKSTNNYAIKLLTKSKPTEGTVVFTKNQESGRGQYGSSWESEPGKNITVSVILYPVFLSLSRQFYLNMIASLAIYDLLEDLTDMQGVRIKWPNDIYIGDDKIGGILIQNSVNGSMIKSTVIGIGLNINQTKFRGGAPNPTSLKLVTGKGHGVELFVSGLLKYLEIRYLQLKENRFDLLKSDYLKHLYRLDLPSFFTRKDGSRFNGKIQGVAADGRLRVLNLNTSTPETFYFKEVNFS